MTPNSTTMNQAVDMLQRAQTYAEEQSTNMDLPYEERDRFKEDESFLSEKLYEIYDYFGTPPDNVDWFWNEDYLKEFPMDA